MQRKLLDALLAALATTALIGALLPLGVLASSGTDTTCDDAGYPEGNKVEAGKDGPYEISGDWGSATWDNDDDRSLDIDMNDGWTVEICIKYGGGVDEYTVSKDKTITVKRGISHVSWMNPTPTTTTTEGNTTSTTNEESTTTTDSSTTTEPTPSSTTTTSTTTTTTTIASSTTSTSSPATTTSTTDPSTTSTIQSSSSTTSSDEVLESTLPFTGGPTDGLPTLALSLFAAGILIVLATRRRTW